MPQVYDDGVSVGFASCRGDAAGPPTDTQSSTDGYRGDVPKKAGNASGAVPAEGWASSPGVEVEVLGCFWHRCPKHGAPLLLYETPYETASQRSNNGCREQLAKASIAERYAS
jgi:hypothetical protein